MKRIEVDTVNGAIAVNQFDCATRIVNVVDLDDVFFYLRTAEDGECFGMELTDDQYEAVKQEYGVRE